MSTERETLHNQIRELLKQLPPPSVLEPAARPIYDRVHKPPGGPIKERIYGRGAVVAQHWPWVKDGDSERLDDGLRLVILRNGELRLQTITGRRSSTDGELWEATTKEVDVQQLLEQWSVDELRAGVYQVLEDAKAPPRRVLSRLAATQVAIRPVSPETAWGPDGRARMARLCGLFPALRAAPGAAPWDGGAMLRYACSGASHGELLAARFVLAVWNSSTDWEEIARQEGIITDPDHHLPRFDLFEAMAVWDDQNREAMMSWLRDPFWP